MKISINSIIAVIKNNLFYKILSVFLAIIVWYVIVQYVNPEDTRRINDIRIEVNTEDSVPAGEGLVLVTDYSQTVNITYKASRDVISILNTDKIVAYVDLSSATKSGEYKFPVKIDTGGQNIVILEQSVKEATLKFEKSATAQVEIDVLAEGDVPEGFVKSDPACVPAVLNIEGPESEVSKIASAQVKISEKKFTATKVYSCDYTFVDAEGNEVSKDYITADFDKVDVTVSVQKTKTIPITATIVNSSGGFEQSFANMTIKPESITVAGSEEVLETLNSYDLGTIEVSDKIDDFEQKFTVSLQNGLKNVDGIETVNVNVDFGDLKTKKINFTKFRIDNLPDNLKAVILDKSLEVTFRGIPADISNINSANVELVVDFKDKEQTKGKNSISIYAVIPEKFKVGVLGKYQVTVDIS